MWPYLSSLLFKSNQKPNHTLRKSSENPETMLSPFSCGFFHPETSDEFDEPIITNSPCSTPRRSSCRRIIHRIHHNNKDSKNPYSTRGLDKFSALMADLEEKRQQIYAQTGSQDDTFVRFVYKDSNDNVPVPIVVKLKEKKQEESKTKPHNHEEKHGDGQVVDKLIEAPAKEEVAPEQQRVQTSSTMKQSMFDFLKTINFRRPSFYLPVVVVLILVLLAVFGRSVAILCTSIGWYAIPTLKEQQSAEKRRRKSSKAAKEQVKIRSSENKAVIGGGEGLSSPKSDNNTTPLSRNHGHRKSW